MGLFSKSPATLYGPDLLDRLPLGLSIYRLDDPSDPASFRLIYSNPASASLTGLRVEAEVGRKIVDVVPGIRETGLLDVYAEIVREGGARDLGQVTYGDDRIAETTYTVRAMALPNRSLAVVFEDVTERAEVQALRDTQAELSRNESRYRSLVEATAAIVWTTPPDGELVDTDAWCRVTGQAPEEAAGWGWLDAVHPDDRDKTAAAWRRAVETQSAYTVEHRLRRAGGGYTHMAVRGAPVLDAHGAVIEWVGVHTDIERQSQAAAALAASEARFRALFDAVSDVLLVYPIGPDGPGRILAFNDAAVTHYGYTPDELQDLTIGDLVDPSSADVEGGLDELRRSRQATFESTHVTKDGRKLPMATSARLVEYDGQLCVVALCRDDTDRRQFRREIARTNADLERAVATQTAAIEAFAEDLQILHAITTAEHDSREARFEAYLRAGCEMFDLPVGILAATPFDVETGRRMYRLEAIVSPDPELAPGLTVPITEAFCDAVVDQAGTVAYGDANDVVPDHPACVDRGFRAYIGSPVVVDGELFGTLNFVSPTPRPDGFSPTERDLIEVMTRAVGRQISIDRAEAERARAEALYRSVLAAAPDGIYGLDLEGRTTFVNPAAVALTGWTADEQEGGRQHDLIHHHRPDGSEYPATECPIYRTLRDGIPRTCDDEVFWRKDGTALAVSYTVTPITEGDAVQGAVVLFRERVPDVIAAASTARAAALVQSVLAASADGVMAFRAVRDADEAVADLEWLVANPRAAEIVRRPAAGLLGRRLLEVFPGNREAGLFDLYADVVDRGVTRQTVVPYAHDGFETTFRVMAVPLPSEDGLVVTFAEVLEAEVLDAEIVDVERAAPDAEAA